VAWMGYRTPRSMTSVHGLTVQGGNLPSEIWKRFMEEGAANIDTGTFPVVDLRLVLSGQDINTGQQATSAPPTVVQTVPAVTATPTSPGSVSVVPPTKPSPPPVPVSKPPAPSPVTSPPSTAPPATPPATAPPATVAPANAEPARRSRSSGPGP